MSKASIKFSELKPYESLVYAIMKKHEKEGVKSTIDNVNFEALEYIAKFPLKIENGATTIKALKKIATPNKTTGEWKLKPVEFDLQKQCAIITKNAKE